MEERLDQLIGIATQILEEIKKSGDQSTPPRIKSKSNISEKVTIVKIREVLNRKRKDGLNHRSKELLQKYGVSKLSDLKEEDYPQFLQEAEVL